MKSWKTVILGVGIQNDLEGLNQTWNVMKKDFTIVCPHCQNEIDVEDALAHQLETKFHLKYQEDKKLMEASFQVKEEHVRKTVSQETTAKVQAEIGSELRVLEGKLKEANEKTEDAEKRAKEAAWTVWNQEKKTLMGLVEKERSLKESALKQSSEERERLEKMVEDARNETANKYLSQREQGESFEQNATDIIKRHFPDDQVEEVKVGAKGTDIILHVRDGKRDAGTISIEFKNPTTKNNWGTWVKKTRDDMGHEGSKLALIVSTVPFESGLQTDGGQVFGSHSSEALGVLTLLRKTVIEIARAGAGAENSDLKAKALSDFFKSSKWDNLLVEAIKANQDILTKVSSIKNAAESIRKNTELVQDQFVFNLKSVVEQILLEKSLKAA